MEIPAPLSTHLHGINPMGHHIKRTEQNLITLRPNLIFIIHRPYNTMHDIVLPKIPFTKCVSVLCVCKRIIEMVTIPLIRELCTKNGRVFVDVACHGVSISVYKTAIAVACGVHTCHGLTLARIWMACWMFHLLPIEGASFQNTRRKIFCDVPEIKSFGSSLDVSLQ